MIAPPNSNRRSSRSLRRARIKRKKAAAALTAKTGARHKPLPAPKQRKPLEIEKLQEHFAAASELLKNVIQSPEISEQFDPQMRTNTRMVYTKGVTLWMLILQRPPQTAGLGRGTFVRRDHSEGGRPCLRSVHSADPPHRRS